MAESATSTSRVSLHLEDRHREEADRLRDRYGDPEEAVSSLIREHFDRDALEEALRSSLESRNLWNDDELDEQ